MKQKISRVTSWAVHSPLSLALVAALGVTLRVIGL